MTERKVSVRTRLILDLSRTLTDPDAILQARSEALVIRKLDI